MKIFKILVLITLTLFQINVIKAQNYPNDGLKLPDDETRDYIESITPLPYNEASANTSLPAYKDNSESPYWRPIFLGGPASCAHSAEIGYTFTYEINRLRNITFDESDSTTYFPIYFTYNFENAGGNNATSLLSGYRWAERMGVPDVKTFGDFKGDTRKWMTGYDKYEVALKNKIKKIHYIEIGTPEGLNKLKHWINDHNEGATVGGIASFATFTNNYDSLDILPPASFDAGKTIIKDMIFQLDENGEPENHGHAMNFVGYNDLVKYDFNGDGEYTNDEDINNDGTVNMLDWEIGALKIANNGGVNWLNSPLFEYPSDSGFIYLPYRLLAKSDFEEYPVYDQKVFVIEVETNYEPKRMLKAKVEHNQRFHVHFYMNDKPQNVTFGNSYRFPGGANFPMQGINDDPIEMCFDFSDEDFWDKPYSEQILVSVYNNTLWHYESVENPSFIFFCR